MPHGGGAAGMRHIADAKANATNPAGHNVVFDASALNLFRHQTIERREVSPPRYSQRLCGWPRPPWRSGCSGSVWWQTHRAPGQRKNNNNKKALGLGITTHRSAAQRPGSSQQADLSGGPTVIFSSWALRDFSKSSCFFSRASTLSRESPRSSFSRKAWT